MPRLNRPKISGLKFTGQKFTLPSFYLSTNVFIEAITHLLKGVKWSKRNLPIATI